MKKVIMLMAIIIFSIMSVINFNYFNISYAIEDNTLEVNLSDLTYNVGEEEIDIKTYSQDEFDTFKEDYESNSLPEIYITEFLFDGVSMVKSYDLDDFIESGNDAKVKVVDIKAFNVNRLGDTIFTGEIKGGMIAVNTNNISGDINIILNGVNIDTDSKKIPAIYVYNKDITYTDCKVTIKTMESTENSIEGGKFKKVSLVGSDELDSYINKYSGDNRTYYEAYTNYYGVYTKDETNNILFAKVQADTEDLADGDPAFFYKGAGAISSDIDLYFEGEGYLKVTSKNKEGIETKGNLTFSGGLGDYYIYAEDDCLNTTTSKSVGNNVRNALTIDVNSLYAIVDPGEDADEGDAIDSNGTLIINGGTVVALAHPGQDAGIDSESGTYINGGTILATGDMYEQISVDSRQNFMALNFKESQNADTLYTLLDENDNKIMSYKTDRKYTNLVYSSDKLIDGTYYLYKNGEIEGTEQNGFYTGITNYVKGTEVGYSSKSGDSGVNGPDGNRPEMPNGENYENPPEPPNGNNNMEPPQNQNNGAEPPEKTDENNQNNNRNPEDGNNGNTSSSNKEFIILGISNLFSGVGDYIEEQNALQQENNNTEQNNSDNNDSTTNNEESSNGNNNEEDNTKENNQNSNNENSSNNESKTNNSNSNSNGDKDTNNAISANTNSSQSNNSNSTKTNTNANNTSSIDNTTANKILPSTGISKGKFILLIPLALLPIYFFKKLKMN